MNRNISIVIIYQVYEHVNSGVILGQNCIQLSDSALDDLFFSRIYFIKISANMLEPQGLLKSYVPFIFF